MKYIVPALFYCFLSFSQTKDSVASKKAINLYDFSIKFDSLSKMKPNFSSNFKTNPVASFSVYNRNTKLNDIYYLSKDSIHFVKTENFNSGQSTPKDSFNPHGASNLGVGLIMGSINTIFKGVFN